MTSIWYCMRYKAWSDGKLGYNGNYYDWIYNDIELFETTDIKSEIVSEQ